MSLFLAFQVVTHIRLLSPGFQPLDKIKVLSCVVPGRGVGPHVSPVVEYDMVLRPAGENVLHRLRLQTSIFAATQHSIGQKAFGVLDELIPGAGPGRKVERYVVAASPLEPDPFADLVSVQPGSLGVYIDLEQLTDDKQELPEVGPNLDHHVIPHQLALTAELQLWYHEVLSYLQHLRQLELAHFCGVENRVVKVQNKNQLLPGEEA
jgi:hypothetical protein